MLDAFGNKWFRALVLFVPLVIFAVLIWTHNSVGAEVGYWVVWAAYMFNLLFTKSESQKHRDRLRDQLNGR